MSDNRQDQNQEIERREQELREREQALRLREMEAELIKGEPPLYEPVKHDPPENSLKRWLRKATKLGAFLGIVIAVAVVAKVATWLAMGVLVLLTGWVGYKLLLKDDD